jgi:predicted ATPase/class 3 adenylate cyclase
VADPRAVTVFLFTDIEGSTRLWEQAPEAMREALVRHDAIAAESVESHHGRVVKTTGDGLHAVFHDPLAAVKATIAMQVALAEAGGDDTIKLRVRAGLNAGVESERDNDYYGTSVNRAARIMSAAHGGQILVSHSVATLLRDRLPPDIALRPLGRLRLRDLSEPEDIYQVVHPRLRAEFPALRSLESTPNNLPTALTSFIGRENELREVCEKLRSVRLLTIFGIGGLGKSRLSLQVAAASLDHFPDGVWFVELAPVADARLVAQTAATVLGIRDDAGQSPHEAIMKFVRDRRLLIVLDNCEHMTQACAELARGMLEAGPAVTILATSRERLGIGGEQTYPLAPFAVPPKEALAPDALAQFPSVRLLSERAASARPDFAITADNAHAVAAICQQLDGIPLALELAAARVRSMSVQRIAERLSDRFKLLSTGDRTSLPRQQTLRALIDWSYDLLSTEEQTLFRRLAVFAGGFTLEAAEQVAEGGAIARDDVQDLVSELVEKSLVVLDAEHDRYRMLETVRQYGVDKLSADEETAIRERFVAYYVDFCERAAPEMTGSDAPRWLELLDEERENVLAAHASCGRAAHGGERDLRLVRAVRRYFFSRGLFNLIYAMTVEALERDGARRRDLFRCRGLSDAGQYALRIGRHEEALRYLTESLAIARELNDDGRIAVVLQPIGLTYLAQGDVSMAREYLDEALVRATARGDRQEVAAALSAIEQLYRVSGDLDAAENTSQQVLSMTRGLGDQQQMGFALVNLAMIAILRGKRDDARHLLREMVAIDGGLGGTPFRQGLLEVAAGIAAITGDFQSSAKLYAAAELLAEASGRRRDAADDAYIISVVKRVRDALPTEAYEEAIRAGRGIATAAAIALAEEISLRR